MRSREPCKFSEEGRAPKHRPGEGGLGTEDAHGLGAAAPRAEPADRSRQNVRVPGLVAAEENREKEILGLGRNHAERTGPPPLAPEETVT